MPCLWNISAVSGDVAPWALRDETVFQMARAPDMYCLKSKNKRTSLGLYLFRPLSFSYMCVCLVVWRTVFILSTSWTALLSLSGAWRLVSVYVWIGLGNYVYVYMCICVYVLCVCI